MAVVNLNQVAPANYNWHAGRLPKAMGNPEFWVERFEQLTVGMPHFGVFIVHLRELNGRILHTSFAYAWWPRTSISTTVSYRIANACERVHQNYMATTRGLSDE